MSENAHEAITAFDEYVTEPRGETFVKVPVNSMITSR